MSGAEQGNEPGAPRLTPYAVAFGGSFASERFPALREERDSASPPPEGPEEFLRLPTAGGTLRDLLPPDAPGVAATEHGRVLYHAFEHWRAGLSVFEFDAAVVRYLVETMPRVGEWALVPPEPAGYIQLPKNLFWARPDEAAPPEPVDGFFWSAAGAGEPPVERLDLLFVLGLRPGRPGFSVIAAEAAVGDLPTGHWADADARPGGVDFANVLPGGEIENLYALTTETELLKLASLLFWYVAQHPDAAEARGEAADDEEVRYAVRLASDE